MEFFLHSFDFLNKGGWVAWVLAILSGVLWYAVGYRYLFLKSTYCGLNPQKLLTDHKVDSTDLLGEPINRLKQVTKRPQKDIETYLSFEYSSFTQNVSAHRQTIRAIVMVAPLLGLLGTVIGMIETFDSLQDAALFSQSGGIAGGISQALITTQMGLVVAIPGLLVGRKLDHKEKELTDSLENVLNYVHLRGSHEASQET